MKKRSAILKVASAITLEGVTSMEQSGRVLPAGPAKDTGLLPDWSDELLVSCHYHYQNNMNTFRLGSDLYCWYFGSWTTQTYCLEVKEGKTKIHL